MATQRDAIRLSQNENAVELARQHDAVQSSSNENAEELARNCNDTTVPSHNAEDTIDMVTDTSLPDNGFEPFNEDELFGQHEEEDAEEDETFDLRKQLSYWCIHNGVTHNATNQLLDILIQADHTDLPKDKRTLCGTLQDISVQQKCDGKFVYMGVEKGIKTVFNQHAFCKNVYLKINADGLPLFKSTKNGVYPILGSFKRYTPFMVAIYYGSGKPEPVNEYLEEFVEEMTELENNPPSYEGQTFTVSILCFICDAPARAHLKGIVYHTGYFACERCCTKGSWSQNRVIYEVHDNLVPRTNEEFRSLKYDGEEDDDNHQHDVTKVYDLNVDMIKGFVIDPMHLIFLGVVKRFLQFLTTRKTSTLAPRFVAAISQRLTDLGGLLPSEFSRQPRTLSDLAYWKATEFRSFVMYTGVVVFKGILKPSAYDHFLSLSIAVYIMSAEDDDYRNTYLNYAGGRLKEFVRNASVEVHPVYCVYNVHNLLHIVDDVRHYNAPLQDISAFPFENCLQTVKKSVRGTRFPLEQIVKRYYERESIDPKLPKNNFKISCNKKDNCFMVDDGLVFLNTKINTGIFRCTFFKLQCLQNFYTKPAPSSRFGTYLLPDNICGELRDISIDLCLKKCICLPFDNSLVVMTLCHDIY